MSFQPDDIVHKGLHRFWLSGGLDTSGISSAWARTLRILMVHLYTAQSIDDIRAGIGLQKKFKRLSGHAHRYSMEVNANWRLTFDCGDPDSGVVSWIDLEDLHRQGGAKRR